MSQYVFCSQCGSDLFQTVSKVWERPDLLTCISREGHTPQAGTGSGYGEGYVAGLSRGEAAANYAAAYGGEPRYDISPYYQRDLYRRDGFADGFAEGVDRWRRADEEDGA